MQATLVHIQAVDANQTRQPVSAANPMPVAGPGTAIAPSTGVVTTYVGNFQSDMIELNLSLDTSAYATGDVLADTQALVLMGSPPAAGIRGEVVGITLLDKDDNAGALDLVILDANQALGTENAAPDISDTNAQQIVAVIPVTASDYTDFGGARIARPDFAPVPFKVAAGTLYIGAISRDAKTYTAAGLRVKVAVRIHNAGLLG